MANAPAGTGDDDGFALFIHAVKLGQSAGRFQGYGKSPAAAMMRACARVLK